MLGKGEERVHQTIIGTGSDPETYTLVGADFVTQIATRATKGVSDQLTFQPNGVSFSAGGSAPLTAVLISTSGKDRRTAQITTTSVKGTSDMFSFSGTGGGLSLVHHGAGTTFNLTLSALGPHSAPQQFQSGPLHIGAGENMRVSGLNWGALAGSSAHVTIGGHTQTIKNRFHMARLASIAALQASPAHKRTVVLTTIARLGKLPPRAQLAYAWTVGSGGHRVASHAVLKPAGTRSASFRFTAKHTGRYTLTATVTVVTLNGVAQSSARAGHAHLPRLIWRPQEHATSEGFVGAKWASSQPVS